VIVEVHRFSPHPHTQAAGPLLENGSAHNYSPGATRDRSLISCDDISRPCPTSPAELGGPPPAAGAVSPLRAPLPRKTEAPRSRAQRRPHNA
jgi:hypothetical protein